MKKRLCPLLLLLLLIFGGCGRELVANEPAPTPELSSYLLASSRSSEDTRGLPLLDTEHHVSYMAAVRQNEFRPEEAVTRIELVRILDGLLTNPVEGVCHFSDVSEDSEDYAALACLTAWGVFTDSEDAFRPDDMLSRAQLVTILSRFYPAPGDPDAMPGSALQGRMSVDRLPEEGPSFTDILGHWAEDEIENAAERGWYEAGGKFYPEAAVTRAELCRVLNRVLGRCCDEAAVILSESYTGFSDVPTTGADFGDIMEATQEHAYSRDESGAESWFIEDLEPGYYRMEGRLFCVKEDGHLCRNEDVGVLHFDESGCYTTGVPETDEAIRAILLELGTDDMSPYNALAAAFLYCTHDHSYIRHDWYSYGFVDYVNDQFPRRALKFIEEGGGDCYDYASCFGLMARALGFDNAYIVKAEVNQFYAAHGFVVIPEDGTDWIYDPELESARPERHDDLDLFGIENFTVYSYWYEPWW